MQALFHPTIIAPIGLDALDGTPATERREPDILVSLANRLVGSRRVSLLLPSEEPDVLRIAAGIGISPLLAKRVRVRLGDPVAGSVALGRRPVLVNDLQVRPNHASRGYRTGSFISVPVPLASDACGVLSVSDPLHPEGFQPEDVRVLEELTQQIAKGFQANVLKKRIGDLEATVQKLRQRVIQAQEAERERIARDLHDEAGHALTAVVMSLDLEAMRFADDSVAVEMLRRVREQLVECSKSLHAIAFDLRPRILEDLGLHATLRSLARQAGELTELDVTVVVRGTTWELDEAQQLAILRLVQEGLTNVRKHARAKRVEIVLNYDPGRLKVHFEDDGTGMSVRETALQPARGRVSMGLAGMRERFELLDGTFSVRTGAAGGTLISVELPR